jgi:arylsulfatase A-like enzyme/HEAT repeat protein
MLRRVSIATSAGIWVGALAGLATALADFGAHWLFMESTGDRAGLLARLLCLLPALGAAFGACAGAWFGLSVPLTAAVNERLGIDGETRRASLVFATLWTLPLVWPAAEVARLLWSGGKMSRLSVRPVGITLTFIVLVGLAVLAVWSGLRISRWLQTARPNARRRVLALVAIAAVATTKLNQHFLPNLYDYLHGLLAVICAALFAFVFVEVGQRSLLRRKVRPHLAIGSAAVLFVLLALAGQLGLGTLDRNQNVRVALLNANMPHSRSLMLGIGPYLPEVDQQSATLAKRRAESARQRRSASTANGSRELPVVEDAHVLMITVDALRSDRLGIHGYARNITPELDAIARRGVSFDRAYAQAPHSSYSLCSLMTSEYLHETLELGQPAPTATLPSVLTQAGYHTAAFYTQGIFHTAGEQLQAFHDDAFGFALHDHQDRPAEEMTDRVLKELDRTLERKEPSTLFWVHYFDVHEPYEATTLGTSDSDRYDSELLATDKAIGRLVREAEKRLHKPLVVLITADHGEEFHDHGGVYHGSSLYDEQVRVPLILLAPQLPAARIAAPVESIDVAPTLLGLLGVDVPASMRGQDLRALALGSAPDRGPVFSAVIHKKMVVRWPWKLIADLRFGLFELYDLEHDPRERDNRADHDPARLDSLRGEVYAWIDSLTPTAAQAPNPGAQALEWGRLGDRRAVKPLAALILDENAAEAERSEAARLLGKLADPTSIDDLLRATRVPARWVAAEAAIALGRMFEPRAAPALRQLVAAEDPGLRSRAAVSLGRLRDKAAVPSLIDALWMAPNTYEREEAVRWLGRLGDPRALDPLMNLLPEPHVRHLVVVALGEIGDERAYAPLLDVLTWDRNANVRDGVVRGLAMLGDARAIDAILPLATDEAGLQHPSEALVRLHALETQRIGGADLQRTAAGSGFGKCQVGPLHHDWDFLHRTVCFTHAAQASLRLKLPAAVAQAPAGSVVLLSLRRTDSTQPTDLELSIGDQALPHVRVDGAWSEERWALPPNALRAGELKAILKPADPNARFEVDHVLIVPRPFSEAASAPDNSSEHGAPRTG